MASGHRSALPHGVASEKVIEHGDAVTMDFGAIFKDYCSDMTRTVFVGNPSGELSGFIILCFQHSKVPSGVLKRLNWKGD